jgi:DEAD/DEAH box helicase domain-containing protein
VEIGDLAAMPAELLRGISRGEIEPCDPRDLGVAIGGEREVPAVFEPNVYLYDNFPGGIGQSEPLFRMRLTLLERARGLIDACPCEAGCPSCVGPAGEAGDKAKEAARRYLDEILAAAPPDPISAPERAITG